MVSLDEEMWQMTETCRRILPWLSGSGKETARKWMDRLNAYKTHNSDIKVTRNRTMKHLINAIREEVRLMINEKPAVHSLSAADHKLLETELQTLGEPNAITAILDRITSGGLSSYMSIWSTDKRSYIAVRPIPGEGALIYMAVTQNPELGWDLPNDRRAPENCDDN